MILGKSWRYWILFLFVALILTMVIGAVPIKIQAEWLFPVLSVIGFYTVTNLICVILSGL